MSLLAGFDYVFEISNATLLKMFKSTVSIDGVLLNPPFDLLLPARSGRLIVNDVQLDIEGDDTVNVSFAFSRVLVRSTCASLQQDSSRPCAAGWNAHDRSRRQAGSGLDNTRELILDIKSAVVRLVYSLAADAIIASRLSTIGIPVATFKDRVAAALRPSCVSSRTSPSPSPRTR